MLSYDWRQHPVITISFADIANATPQELISGIKVYLQRIAKRYQIDLDVDNSPGQMLRDLVEELSQKASVVILIDE